MPHALDWSGSELRDIAVDGATVRLRLAAAEVRTADGERGWLAGVSVTLAHATLDGDAATAFGRIAEGRLRVDGRDRPAGIPQAVAGTIELQLRLANGTSLGLRGGELTIAAADDARFSPDLSC
jgi:hypothetical protein